MLPIVEIFTSIQGEGKYSGTPSVFIRVAGCNLKCCFGDSICDTYYTSYYTDKPRYTVDDVCKYLNKNTTKQTKHIVITGGEPLLYKTELESLVKQISFIQPYTITIETNGTLPALDLDSYSINIYYSISPKLSTAVAKPGQLVEIPGENGRKHLFSEEEVNKFNKIRINYDSLYSLTQKGNYQFKFVYTDFNSVEEIKHILNTLESKYHTQINNSQIYLMPEGDIEEKLQQKREECVQECIDHGWNYTDRIHILIWGSKREV